MGGGPLLRWVCVSQPAVGGAAACLVWAGRGPLPGVPSCACLSDRHHWGGGARGPHALGLQPIRGNDFGDPLFARHAVVCFLSRESSLVGGVCPGWPLGGFRLPIG